MDLRWYQITFRTLVFMLFLSVGRSIAGIVCKPPAVFIHSVTVGRKFPASGKISEIKNTGEESARYRVSFLSCREIDKRPWLSYYEDIPSSDWFIPKSTEITVPASGVGYVKDVYIKIPKEKKYYGRKFQAYAKIRQIAPVEGMIQTEVLIPIFIETEKKPPSLWERFLKIFKRKKSPSTPLLQRGEIERVDKGK